MSKWGSAMRAARIKRGLSMQKLAGKSGVSLWSIHDYEHGKHEPQLFNLVCLADALEIPLDEYIGREVHKKEDTP